MAIHTNQRTILRSPRTINTSKNAVIESLFISAQHDAITCYILYDDQNYRKSCPCDTKISKCYGSRDKQSENFISLWLTRGKTQVTRKVHRAQKFPACARRRIGIRGRQRCFNMKFAYFARKHHNYNKCQYYHVSTSTRWHIEKKKRFRSQEGKKKLRT